MAEEELARRFGELARRLRREQGHSQEGFYFRVGLHQAYGSSVERGERNVTIRDRRQDSDGAGDHAGGTVRRAGADLVRFKQRMIGPTSLDSRGFRGRSAWLG